MKNIIEKWVKYLKAMKDSSDNTLNMYTRHVNKFLNWCDENSVSYESITALQMLNDYYIEQLGEKGSSTKDQSRSALRNFYKYLMTQGIIEYDPTALLESAPSVSKKKAYLDSSEMRDVLDYIKDDKGINVYLKDKNYEQIKTRDYAMIYAYFVGMFRNQELANITISDIDFDECTILVKSETAKRRKERVVGINKNVANAIKEYLKHRPESECDNVFLTITGKPMSGKVIGKMIKKYMVACGHEDITCHSLRRSGSTMYVDELGCDIYSVSLAMGHSSPTTTSLYIQSNKKAQKLGQEVDF